MVIALIAALMIPPFFNWDDYRENFEQEASRLVGLPVEVRGSTSVRFLPLPSIRLNDIRVGGSDDRPLLEAESFQMNIELAPLLRREIVIVDMTIQRPRLSIEIAKDGSLTAFHEVASSGFDVSDREISLENVVVQNGALRIYDEGSEEEDVIRDINLTGIARELRGPWQITGEVTRKQVRHRVSLSTGRWQNPGRINLKASIEPQNRAQNFDFVGPLEVKDARPVITGAFTLRTIARQSAEDRISFPRPVGDSLLKMRTEGNLVLKPGRLDVSLYRSEFGDQDDPYVVTGSGFLTFGEKREYELTAKGQQINLSRGEHSEGEAGARSLEARLHDLQTVLADLPDLAIRGSLKINLPAMVMGDTIVRDINLDANQELDSKNWSIKNLEAKLPGLTTLSAKSGRLKLGNSLSYEGSLLLNSNQPSGFAGWLTNEVGPAISQMKQAGIEADVILNSRQLSLNNFQLFLDGRELTGSFKRVAAGDDGTPASITADLAGESADFDQMRALFGLFTGGAGTEVSGHVIDLKMVVDKLKAFGIVAKKVDAELKADSETLSLPKLKIDEVLGINVSGSGDFPLRGGGTALGLSLNVKSDDPSPLLDLVDRRFGPLAVLEHLRADPSLLAGSDLKFTVNRDPARPDTGLSVTIVGTAGASELDVNLSGPENSNPASLLSADVLHSASFSLVNEDASLLLAQLAIPVVPIAIAGQGEVSIDLVATKDARTFELDLTSNLADTVFKSFGRIVAPSAWSLSGLSGELEVNLNSENLDGALLLSGLPFSALGEGHSAKISSHAVIANQTIRLEKLDGNIGDAGFAGELTLNARAQPRPTVSGRLQISSLDAATITGFVHTGEAPDLQSSGLRDSEGVDVNAAVPALLDGLDGEVSLRINQVGFPHDLNLPGLAGATSDLKISDGDLRFDNFKAGFAGGTVDGELQLAKSSNTRLVSGDIHATGISMGTFLPVLGLEDVASGEVELSGSFQSSALNTSALIENLTGNGTISVRDGTLNHFNAGVFPALLSNLDREERAERFITAEDLETAGLFDGAMAFDPLTTDFSIAEGVLRINDAAFLTKGTSLKGSIRHELANGQVAAELRAAFDPGRDAIRGASPELGISITGNGRDPQTDYNFSLIATYLAMRVAERRERQFESQRSNILERQRLLRLVRLYTLEEEARIEAERKRQEAERLERERKEAERLERERQAEEARKARQKAQSSKKKEPGEDPLPNFDNAIDSLSKRVLDSIVIE